MQRTVSSDQKDVDVVLKNCRDCLKPGGMLLIFDHDYSRLEVLPKPWMKKGVDQEGDRDKLQTLIDAYVHERYPLLKPDFWSHFGDYLREHEYVPVATPNSYSTKRDSRGMPWLGLNSGQG